MVEHTLSSTKKIVIHPRSSKNINYIATIVWYFSYARHQGTIFLPANYLNNYFIENVDMTLDNLNLHSGNEDDE